jgi:hypothetical protein
MPASISAITRRRPASARTGVQPSLARPSRRDCRRPSTVTRSQKLASAPFLNVQMLAFVEHYNLTAKPFRWT